MTKVKLPQKKITQPEPVQLVRIRVVSEIVTQATDLTGDNKSYESMDDLIAAIEDRMKDPDHSDGPFAYSWSELLSDNDVWSEDNFTELELTWAEETK